MQFWIARILDPEIQFWDPEDFIVTIRSLCNPELLSSGFLWLKAQANEDTLLWTHCCQHKCFPVCLRAQHLLWTQIWCPGHKKCFWFFQKHFVSATNVSQFAQPKKHHGQQCVHNNASSFTRAFNLMKVGGGVTSHWVHPRSTSPGLSPGLRPGIVLSS